MIRIFTALLLTLPLSAQSARELVEQGMDKFVAGQIAASVKDFDAAAKLSPESAPQLWQRGIALYYLKQYEEGRKQFESHRLVNPNDVENAAWWYLCMARLNRRKEAQEKLLPVGPDDRIPMTEIYALYSGKGTEKQVIAAMESGDVNERDRKIRRFYGYLYLGLFAEANGALPKANDYLRKSVQQNVGGYMWEVARIHLEQKPSK
jgi:lipoprotein NlpI